METVPAGWSPSWPHSDSSTLYWGQSGPQALFPRDYLHFTFYSEKEGLACSQPPPLLRRPILGSSVCHISEKHSQGMRESSLKPSQGVRELSSRNLRIKRPTDPGWHRAQSPRTIQAEVCLIDKADRALHFKAGARNSHSKLEKGDLDQL